MYAIRLSGRKDYLCEVGRSRDYSFVTCQRDELRPHNVYATKELAAEALDKARAAVAAKGLKERGSPRPVRLVAHVSELI